MLKFIFGTRIEKGVTKHLKIKIMKLEIIYELLKLKADKLMTKGDVAAYLRTLNRMNEVKVSLATV